MKTFNDKPKVCNVCQGKAKLWYDNKWWCGIYYKIGLYNMIGYCEKEDKHEIPCD